MPVSVWLGIEDCTAGDDGALLRRVHTNVVLASERLSRV